MIKYKFIKDYSTVGTIDTNEIPLGAKPLIVKLKKDFKVGNVVEGTIEIRKVAPAPNVKMSPPSVVVKVKDSTTEDGKPYVGVGTFYIPQSVVEKIEKNNEKEPSKDSITNDADDKIMGLPKTAFWIGVGVIAVVGGYFGYKKFIVKK